MNPLLINHNESHLLHSACIGSSVLEVREFKSYRWFTLGGSVIQALMDKQDPQQVLMPVCQSMLLFTLWKKSSLNILNLGMGAGSFERFFDSGTANRVTSVESCPHVVAMAKEYFALPEQINIHCQSAENYIQSTSELFDIVLCDIFSDQQNVACVSQTWFYEALSNCISNNGLVSINLDPIDENHTLKILQLAARHFSNIVVVDFDDYKNFVLLLSQSEIPDKDTLVTQNKLKMSDIGIDFTKHISSMHYLPSN